MHTGPASALGCFACRGEHCVDSFMLLLRETKLPYNAVSKSVLQL